MSKVQRTAALLPSTPAAEARPSPRRGLAPALPRPRPRGDSAAEGSRSPGTAPPTPAPAAPAAPAAPRRRPAASRPADLLEIVRRAEEIERNLEAEHLRWILEEERRQAADARRRHGLTVQPGDVLEQVRLTLHSLHALHPGQHTQVVQRLLPPQMIAAYLPVATPRDLFFLANYMSAEQLLVCVTPRTAEQLGPHLQNPGVLYTCLQAGLGSFLVPWCSVKLLESFLAVCPGGASMITPYLEDLQVLQLLPARAQLLVPCLSPRHIELCLERGWAPQIVRYLQPGSCAGIAGFKLRPLGRLLRHNPWLFCWLTIEQLAMLELSDVVLELAHISFLTPFEQMPEQSFAVISHLLSEEQLRLIRRQGERSRTPLQLRALVGAGGQG